MRYTKQSKVIKDHNYVPADQVIRQIFIQVLS